MTSIESIQDDLIRRRKKYDKWALNNDMIAVIFFFILCVAWYKAVVQGAYWGEALHVVGETHNESYAYYSSDEDSDQNNRYSNSSSRHDFHMKDDKLQFGKDLTMQPDPAITVDDRTYLDTDVLKKSNYSQRNFKNSFAFQKQTRFGCETVKNLKTTSERIS